MKQINNELRDNLHAIGIKTLDDSQLYELIVEDNHLLLDDDMPDACDRYVVDHGLTEFARGIYINVSDEDRALRVDEILEGQRAEDRNHLNQTWFY